MARRSIEQLFAEILEDEVASVDSDLLYAIHETSRHISTRFDQAMNRHRITHAQWWAMMHIARHNGATQIRLAGYMQMGRAPAGKLLERLEANGWIERRPDPSDSRVKRIYLAEGAFPFFETMNAEALMLFHELLGNIDRKDVARTYQTIKSINQNSLAHHGGGS